MSSNPQVLKNKTEKDQTSPVQTATNQKHPVQTTSGQSELVQTTTAQTGATVNAPALHGNVFHGPVKINIGAQHEGEDRSEEAIHKSAAAFPTTCNARTSDDISIIMKKQFKEKFTNLYEGTSQEGDYVPLKDIFTELYVIEGCTGGVNSQHEVRQIEAFFPKPEETSIKFTDIFKVQSDQNVLGTKVLTLGIAGVGKTASVHKFILDWAEDRCNQDLDFILFLPFRELNLIRDDQQSLSELLLYFHPELCSADVMEVFNRKYTVALILDGLDESKIPLNFCQKKVSNVKEKTTLDKLITSLIKAVLLPSAVIWITSRPAAANQIPRKYFTRVTEIRGFNDLQKEEYFRKRIRDQDQASRIISHIKTARSLHILCHIPVFCWISVSVLQEMLKNDKDMKNAPTTITEMYTRFLLFHTRQKSEKYNTDQNEDSTVPSSDRGRLPAESILKLGRLAFLQLQKGQLIFYEKDLWECGIELKEAVVYSGVCTQIFKKDEKIFSFVHLSFQEFLAAVFVFLTFSDKCNPLLQTLLEKIRWRFKHTLDDLLKIAVNKTMKSKNGHMDLFLRFLLGLSLESNQRLLKTLQPDIEIKREDSTVNYIKRKIHKNKSSEKTISLFHCLSELKDNSLTREIQEFLNSGFLSTQELSPTQWSALVFVLLISEEAQEKFELRKYRASEEGLKTLLPVVKNTRRALLDHCSLSKEICKTLASVLMSDSALIQLDLSNNDLQDSGVELLSAGLKSSHCKLQILRLASCNLGVKTCEALGSVLKLENSSLKELDLSNNDLQDSGVELLSAGLKSSHCKLQILRVSGCMVTEKGCSSLATALSSNPSHLKELDLTYNHPGESGVKLLSARLEDLHCTLTTLRVEHGGKIRIKPGLKKYGCDLTLDPNTAHTRLSLSEGNRKVVWGEELQSYPDHPERFDECLQVMSRESLTGRCYWEAEWSGRRADVALTYKTISRKGWTSDCWFGQNEESWSLICSDEGFSVHHNNNSTALPPPPSSCRRVGVYVDCPAGTLSFYSVSSDTHTLTHSHTLTHLHTLNTTFTQPLYAGIRVYYSGSSVSLCKIE